MDLGSVDQIIEREDLTPVVAFHSQQCVEKCFKAVLEEHSQKVPKEHSTLKLYGLVRQLIPLDADVEILTDLDDLYIESRYPGELGLLPDGKPTRAEAQQFYDCAKSVYEQVKRSLDARQQDPSPDRT
ncbi:MAG: HEPN domain-containing protein [Planctomycetes bacterium]|nr:HEPN domain-containing protein [Planctomycetota bacterium]